MLKKDNDNNNLPGFVNYEFDILANAILESQRNAKKIKREYDKLSKFYKTHPEILLDSLHTTKEELELKNELSEFEKMSLNEINNLLNNNTTVDEMFFFEDVFLLDNYSKAFLQITKKDKEIILTAPFVDIIYYGVQNEIENIPIGEYFSDGTINTGSKIILKIVKVDPRIVITNYQLLFN